MGESMEYQRERERTMQDENENENERRDGDIARVRSNLRATSRLMGQGSQLLFAELVVDGVASSVWDRMSGVRWGMAWHLTSARAASDVQ